MDLTEKYLTEKTPLKSMSDDEVMKLWYQTTSDISPKTKFNKPLFQDLWNELKKRKLFNKI